MTAIISPSPAENHGEARARAWLQPGNLKLGKVLKFNLPTGRPEDGGTCPGATEWCAGKPGEAKFTGACFASHRRVTGWNKRPVVREARDRNLRELLAPGGFERFATEVIEELRRSKVKTVRIHESGDMFHPEQVRAWTRIAKAAPDVRFWAYTHSFSIEALQVPLAELQACPNVQLFASLDPVTKGRQVPAGWRRAIVIENLAEKPENARVCPLSLITINRRKGLVPGATTENNHRLPKDCLNCGFCIDPSTTQQDVVFLRH